ncbi:hypothetical protein Vafri_3096 [Volvox africanus]|uniref:MEKHLA domain-containing protein n=1 Tax=Volvox africanus TaxID=51714 RepID=A0A8J4ETI2_9CHLO|nr:hypothetical protein Vafri_3096 [Volvox africanus]
MRSCQAAAGSRTDALTTQPSTFVIRYGASARGLTPSSATVLLGCPRHALQRTPRTPRSNHLFSRQLSQASFSNSSNTGPGPLSAEEEAAYQEFMEQRQAERKAWKMEVRRRAKFDPMATPGALSTSTAAAAKPPQQRVAGVMPKSAPALRALSRPKAPPPATPPNHLPQPRSAAAAASGGGMNGGESAVVSAADAPSSTLVDLAATRNVSTAPKGRLDKYDGNEEIIELDDEDEDDDGGLDLGGIAAMARKVLDEDDEEATAAAVPVAARGSSGAVHTREAAAKVVRRAPGTPAPKRRLMPIAQLQRQGASSMSAPPTQPPALLPASRKEAAGSAAVEDEGDDLDWDALQAYEKYEQYVNEVTEEEERAARAAARRAASAAASTSTSGNPAKPAPAADVSADAASASTSGDVATKGGRRRRDGTTSMSSASDPTEKLDRQLNQWEQLLNFFEIVERDGKREEAQKQRLQGQAGAKAAAAAAAAAPNSAGTKAREVSGKTGGGASTAAAVSSAATAAVGGMSLAAGLEELVGSGGQRGGDLEDDDVEVEVDWQSLERLFLGEGWEAELADLRKKEAEPTVAGKGAAGRDDDGDDEVESWGDEVSTLLLGLVEISAKRYLGRSLITLPPSPQQPAAAAGAGGAGGEEMVAHRSHQNATPEGAAVEEEERAAVFWEAPFLLLVQDDSADPLIEYANRAALSALQIHDFDEATAGMSAASLVDPTHPRSQQEWLWACTEASERVERYATIPSLRLRGPGPGSPAVLASDVTVFRLDSLEEQPIGEVIVARSWKRLLPDEEDEKEAGRKQG